MFGSGEIIVVIAVIVMLFGSSQIPKMAKNLGLAQKELKAALSGDDTETEQPGLSNEKAEAAAAARGVDSTIEV